MGTDNGPMNPKNLAAARPAPRPIGAPEMRMPSARKIAKATPKLEDFEEKPHVKIGDKKLVYADQTTAPSIFRSRIFIFVMAAAGLGAYYHFENAPVPSVATNESRSQTEVAKNPTETSTPSMETEPSRSPASPLDAPVYVPQGATGYINVKSFPSATKIMVDGQILVDSDGNPVRAPANLQRVAVGTQRIRLENPALGVSWEGEVKVEFDSVKKLEVRLQ
jgi:hypothetical protein